MKQVIEIEEIGKLPTESRKKLHLWLLEREYSTLEIPLGVLIEFLDEHIGSPIIIRVVDSFKNRIAWELSLPEPTGKLYETPGRKEELCDALWEAVKEVLEHDKTS